VEEEDSVILEIDEWDLRLLPIERRAQSSDDSDGWEEPIAATPDDDGCSDSTEAPGAAASAAAKETETVAPEETADERQTGVAVQTQAEDTNLEELRVE
jgi:hypothetical protein